MMVKFPLLWACLVVLVVAEDPTVQESVAEPVGLIPVRLDTFESSRRHAGQALSGVTLVSKEQQQQRAIQELYRLYSEQQRLVREARQAEAHARTEVVESLQGDLETAIGRRMEAKRLKETLSTSAGALQAALTNLSSIRADESKEKARISDTDQVRARAEAAHAHTQSSLKMKEAALAKLVREADAAHEQTAMNKESLKQAQRKERIAKQSVELQKGRPPVQSDDGAEKVLVGKEEELRQQVASAVKDTQNATFAKTSAVHTEQALEKRLEAAKRSRGGLGTAMEHLEEQVVGAALEVQAQTATNAMQEQVKTQFVGSASVQVGGRAQTAASEALSNSEASLRLFRQQLNDTQAQVETNTRLIATLEQRIAAGAKAVKDSTRSRNKAQLRGIELQTQLSLASAEAKLEAPNPDPDAPNATEPLSAPNATSPAQLELLKQAVEQAQKDFADSQQQSEQKRLALEPMRKSLEKRSKAESSTLHQISTSSNSIKQSEQRLKRMATAQQSEEDDIQLVEQQLAEAQLPSSTQTHSHKNELVRVKEEFRKKLEHLGNMITAQKEKATALGQQVTEAAHAHQTAYVQQRSGGISSPVGHHKDTPMPASFDQLNKWHCQQQPNQTAHLLLVGGGCSTGIGMVAQAETALSSECRKAFVADAAEAYGVRLRQFSAKLGSCSQLVPSTLTGTLLEYVFQQSKEQQHKRKAQVADMLAKLSSVLQQARMAAIKAERKANSAPEDPDAATAKLAAKQALEQVRNANLAATAATLEGEEETAHPEYESGRSVPSTVGLFAPVASEQTSGAEQFLPAAVAVAAFIVPAQTEEFAGLAFGPQVQQGTTWNCSKSTGGILVPDLVLQNTVPTVATARMNLNPGSKCISRFAKSAADKFADSLAKAANNLLESRPVSAALNASAQSSVVGNHVAPLLQVIMAAHKTEIKSAVQRTASLREMMNRTDAADQVVEQSKVELNEARVRTEQSRRENDLLQGSVQRKKRELDLAISAGELSQESSKRASLAVAERLLDSSAALKTQNEQEETEKERRLTEKVASAEKLRLEMLAAQHSVVVDMQAKARAPAEKPLKEVSEEERMKLQQLQQEMKKPLSEQAKVAALLRDTASTKEKAAEKEAERQALAAAEAIQEKTNAKQRLDAAQVRERELQKSETSLAQDQDMIRKTALTLEEKVVEQQLRTEELRRQSGAAANSSSSGSAAARSIDEELMAAQKELLALQRDHSSELHQLGISEKMADNTAAEMNTAQVEVEVQVGKQVLAADASTSALSAAAVARENATHAVEEYALRRVQDEQVRSATVAQQDSKVEMLRLQSKRESNQLEEIEAKEEQAQAAAVRSVANLAAATAQESKARKDKALAKLRLQMVGHTAGSNQTDADKSSTEAKREVAESTGSERASQAATQQANDKVSQQELKAKQQEEMLAKIMGIAEGIQDELLSTEHTSREERMELLEQAIHAAERGKVEQDAQLAKLEQAKLMSHKAEELLNSHESSVNSAQDAVAAALMEQKTARDEGKTSDAVEQAVLQSQKHLADETKRQIELQAAAATATLVVQSLEQTQKRLDAVQSDLVASLAAAYKTLQGIDQQEDSTEGSSASDEKVQDASADKVALVQAVDDLRLKVQQCKTKQATLERELKQAKESHKLEIEAAIRLSHSECAALVTRLDHEQVVQREAAERLKNATAFSAQMKRVKPSVDALVQSDQARADAVQASQEPGDPVEDKTHTVEDEVQEQVAHAQKEQLELQSLSNRSQQISEAAQEEEKLHGERAAAAEQAIEVAELNIDDSKKEKAKQAAAVEETQAALKVARDQEFLLEKESLEMQKQEATAEAKETSDKHLAAAKEETRKQARTAVDALAKEKDAKQVKAQEQQKLRVLKEKKRLEEEREEVARQQRQYQASEAKLLNAQTSVQEKKEKIFEARMKTMELQEKKEEEDNKLHSTNLDLSQIDINSLMIDTVDANSDLGILMGHSELDEEKQAEIAEIDRLEEGQRNELHLAQLAEQEEGAAERSVLVLRETMQKQKTKKKSHMGKMFARTERMKALTAKEARLKANEKEVQVKLNPPPPRSVTAAVTKQEQLIKATSQKIAKLKSDETDVEARERKQKQEEESTSKELSVKRQANEKLRQQKAEEQDQAAAQNLSKATDKELSVKADMKEQELKESDAETKELGLIEAESASDENQIEQSSKESEEKESKQKAQGKGLEGARNAQEKATKDKAAAAELGNKKIRNAVETARETNEKQVAQAKQAAATKLQVKDSAKQRQKQQVDENQKEKHAEQSAEQAEHAVKNVEKKKTEQVAGKESQAKSVAAAENKNKRDEVDESEIKDREIKQQGQTKRSELSEKKESKAKAAEVAALKDEGEEMTALRKAEVAQEQIDKENAASNTPSVFQPDKEVASKKEKAAKETTHKSETAVKHASHREQQTKVAIEDENRQRIRDAAKEQDVKEQTEKAQLVQRAIAVKESHDKELQSKEETAAKLAKMKAQKKAIADAQKAQERAVKDEEAAKHVAEEEAERSIKSAKENSEKKRQEAEAASHKEADAKYCANAKQEISQKGQKQAEAKAQVERETKEKASKETQNKATQNQEAMQSMQAITANATEFAVSKSQHASESKQKLVTAKEMLQKVKLTENEVEARKLQSQTEAAEELLFKAEHGAQVAKEKEQEATNAMTVELSKKEQKKLQLAGTERRAKVSFENRTLTRDKESESNNKADEARALKDRAEAEQAAAAANAYVQRLKLKQANATDAERGQIESLAGAAKRSAEKLSSVEHAVSAKEKGAKCALHEIRDVLTQSEDRESRSKHAEKQARDMIAKETKTKFNEAVAQEEMERQQKALEAGKSQKELFTKDFQAASRSAKEQKQKRAVTLSAQLTPQVLTKNAAVGDTQLHLALGSRKAFEINQTYVVGEGRFAEVIEIVNFTVGVTDETMQLKQQLVDEHRTGETVQLQKSSAAEIEPVKLSPEAIELAQQLERARKHVVKERQKEQASAVKEQSVKTAATAEKKAKAEEMVEDQKALVWEVERKKAISDKKERRTKDDEATAAAEEAGREKTAKAALKAQEMMVKEQEVAAAIEAEKIRRQKEDAQESLNKMQKHLNEATQKEKTSKHVEEQRNEAEQKASASEQREKQAAKQWTEAASKETESKAKQTAALSAQVKQEKALQEAQQTQERLVKDGATQERQDSAKESTQKRQVDARESASQEQAAKNFADRKQKQQIKLKQKETQEKLSEKQAEQSAKETAVKKAEQARVAKLEEVQSKEVEKKAAVVKQQESQEKAKQKETTTKKEAKSKADEAAALRAQEVVEKALQKAREQQELKQKEQQAMEEAEKESTLKKLEAAKEATHKIKLEQQRKAHKEERDKAATAKELETKATKANEARSKAELAKVAEHASNVAQAKQKEVTSKEGQAALLKAAEEQQKVLEAAQQSQERLAKEQEQASEAQQETIQKKVEIAEKATEKAEKKTEELNTKKADKAFEERTDKKQVVNQLKAQQQEQEQEKARKAAQKLERRAKDQVASAEKAKKDQAKALAAAAAIQERLVKEEEEASAANKERIHKELELANGTAEKEQQAALVAAAKEKKAMVDAAEELSNKMQVLKDSEVRQKGEAGKENILKAAAAESASKAAMSEPAAANEQKGKEFEAMEAAEKRQQAQEAERAEKAAIDEQRERHSKAQNAAALQEQIERQKDTEAGRAKEDGLEEQATELAGIEKERVQKQAEAAKEQTHKKEHAARDAVAKEQIVKNTEQRRLQHELDIKQKEAAERELVEVAQKKELKVKEETAAAIEAKRKQDQQLEEAKEAQAKMEKQREAATGAEKEKLEESVESLREITQQQEAQAQAANAREKQAKAAAAEERKAKAEELKASEARARDAVEKEVEMKKAQAELKLKAEVMAAQKHAAERKEKALAVESLKKEAEVKQAAEKMQKAEEQMAAELEKAADEVAREKADKAQAVADEQKEKQQVAFHAKLKAQNEQALALEADQLKALEASNMTGIFSDEQLQAQEMAFTNPKAIAEEFTKSKASSHAREAATAETPEAVAEQAIEAGEAQVDSDLSAKRQMGHELETTTATQEEYSSRVQAVLDEDRESDDFEAKADQRIAGKEEEFKLWKEQQAAESAAEDNPEDKALAAAEAHKQAAAGAATAAIAEVDAAKRALEEAAASGDPAAIAKAKKALADAEAQKSAAADAAAAADSAAANVQDSAGGNDSVQKANLNAKLVQLQRELELLKADKQKALARGHDGELKEMLHQEAEMQKKVDAEEQSLSRANRKIRLDSFKLQEERNDAQEGREGTFNSLQKGAEGAERKLEEASSAKHTLETECDAKRQVTQQKSIQLVEARLKLQSALSDRILADQRVQQLKAQYKEGEAQISDVKQSFAPFDTNLDLKKELVKAKAAGNMKQSEERRAKAVKIQIMTKAKHQQLRYDVSKANSAVIECSKQLITAAAGRGNLQQEAEQEQHKFVTDGEAVLASEHQTGSTSEDELTDELSTVEALTEMEAQSMQKEAQGAEDVKRAADQAKFNEKDLKNCERVLVELKYRLRSAEHGMLRAQQAVAKTKSALDTRRLRRFQQFLVPKRNAFEAKDAACNRFRQKAVSETAKVQTLQQRLDAATAASVKRKVSLTEEKARLKRDNVEQTSDNAAAAAKTLQRRQVEAVAGEERQAAAVARSETLTVKSDSLKVEEAEKQLQRAEDQLFIANTELARTEHSAETLDHQLTKVGITTSQLKRQLRLNEMMEPLKSSTRQLHVAATEQAQHYDAMQRQVTVTELQLQDAQHTEAKAAAQQMIANASQIPTELIAHASSRNVPAGARSLHLEAGTRAAFKIGQTCAFGSGSSAEVVEIFSFEEVLRKEASMTREEKIVLKHPLKNAHQKGDTLWQSEHFYAPLAEQADDKQLEAAARLKNATAATKVARAVRQGLQQLLMPQKLKATEAKRAMQKAYEKAYFVAAVGAEKLTNVTYGPHLELMLHSVVKQRQETLRLVKLKVHQIENSTTATDGKESVDHASLDDLQFQAKKLVNEIFTLATLIKALNDEEGSKIAHEIEIAKEEEHHSAQQAAQKELDHAKEVVLNVGEEQIALKMQLEALRKRKQAAEAAVAAQKARVVENRDPNSRDILASALKVKTRAATSLLKQIESGRKKLGQLAEKQIGMNNQVKQMSSKIEASDSYDKSEGWLSEAKYERMRLGLQKLESGFGSPSKSEREMNKIKLVQVKAELVEVQDEVQRAHEQIAEPDIERLPPVQTTGDFDHDALATEKDKTRNIMRASQAEDKEEAKHSLPLLARQAKKLKRSISSLLRELEKKIGPERKTAALSKGSSAVGMVEIEKCVRFSGLCTGDTLSGAEDKTKELKAKLEVGVKESHRLQLQQVEQQESMISAIRVQETATNKVKNAADTAEILKARAASESKDLKTLQDNQATLKTDVKHVLSMQKTSQQSAFDALKEQVKEAGFSMERIDAERTDKERVVFARMTQHLAKSAHTHAQAAQVEVKMDSGRLDLTKSQLLSAEQEQAAAHKAVAEQERKLRRVNQMLVVYDHMPAAPRPDTPTAPAQPSSPALDNHFSADDRMHENRRKRHEDNPKIGYKDWERNFEKVKEEAARRQNVSGSVLCLRWSHEAPSIWVMDSDNKVSLRESDVEYQVSYTRDLAGQLGWVAHRELIRTKRACATDWNLLPGSQYLFRVRAKTSFGWGSWSGISLPMPMPVSEWICPVDKTLKAAITIHGSLCASRLTLTAKHLGGWMSDVIVSYISAAPTDSIILGGGAMVSFANGDARTSDPCAKALAAHIAAIFGAALTQTMHLATQDCPPQPSTKYDGIHREFVHKVDELEHSELQNAHQIQHQILNSTQDLKFELKSFVDVNSASAAAEFLVGAVKAIQQTADFIHTSHQELQKAVAVADADANDSNTTRVETKWYCNLTGPLEQASLVALSRPCSAALSVRVLEATKGMSPECSQELNHHTARLFVERLHDYAKSIPQCDSLFSSAPAITNSASELQLLQYELADMPSSSWLHPQLQGVLDLQATLEQAKLYQAADPAKAFRMVQKVSQGALWRGFQLAQQTKLSRKVQDALLSQQAQAKSSMARVVAESSIRWTCSSDSAQQGVAVLQQGAACVAWQSFQARPEVSLVSQCQEEFFSWAAQQFEKSVERLAQQLAKCTIVHAAPAVVEQRAVHLMQSESDSEILATGSELEQQASEWMHRAKPVLAQLKAAASRQAKTYPKSELFATAAEDEEALASASLQTASQQLSQAAIAENRASKSEWQCTANTDSMGAVYTAQHWTRASSDDELSADCQRELVVNTARSLAQVASQVGSGDGVAAVPSNSDGGSFGVFSSDGGWASGTLAMVGYFGATPAAGTIHKDAAQLIQDAGLSPKEQIKAAIRIEKVAADSVKAGNRVIAGLGRVKTEMLQLQQAANASIEELKGVQEPEVSYTRYQQLSSRDQVMASKVWLISANLERAKGVAKVAKAREQQLKLEVSGQQEMLKAHTAAQSQTAEEVHVKDSIAEDAQIEGVAAKVHQAEVMSAVRRQQDHSQRKKLDQIAEVIKERERKFQNAKMAIDPAGGEKAAIEQHQKVSELNSKVQAAKQRRNRIMDERGQIEAMVADQQSEMKKEESKLSELSHTATADSKEELLEAKRAYTQELEHEANVQGQCDKLTEAAFQASRHAEVQAWQESQLVRDIQSSQAQKVILTHIRSALEHKQIELRMYWESLKADNATADASQQAPLEKAISKAGTAYKDAKKRTAENRLDERALDLRIVDERLQLRKARPRAKRLAVVAEEAQAKADAACAQYRQSKEQLYSSEERAVVAASSGVKAQRQAQLQAEVTLRLETGKLEQAEEELSDARRAKDADMQQAELVKVEQKAQHARVASAKIELQQDEASAFLEKQVSGQQQFSQRATSRMSRDEQTLKVAAEKAALAGTDLAELTEAIREKQRQIESKLTQHKEAAAIVEAAKHGLEALKKANTAAANGRRAKVAQVVESARQQAASVTQQQKRNSSVADEVLFKPPAEEWGDTVHMMNNVPALQDRQSRDHTQQELEAKSCSTHMDNLAIDVESRQNKMEELAKETQHALRQYASQSTPKMLDQLRH